MRAHVRSSRALERVLARNANHPGALHLWIHLWEATDTPERAEAEADRLVPLMPGAGHMVHMPAHIYQRVGRHADVIRVNELAAKADEEYIAQCKAQGVYPLGYYPHNLHFIWMGATASGQKSLALESARKLANQVPREALANVPILQGFLMVPYWAMVRFEEWNAILADKGPEHATLFTRSVWHYARGLAFTALDQLDAAERELAKLRELVADPNMKKEATFSANNGFAILRIAPEVVAGEIAVKQRDFDRAIAALRARRSLRGCVDLSGAARLARAGATEPGGGTRGCGPTGRSGNGVLGGSQAACRERLVAVRAPFGAPGAGPRPRGGPRRGAIEEGLAKRRIGVENEGPGLRERLRMNSGAAFGYQPSALGEEPLTADR